MSKHTRWISSLPKTCDICHSDLQDVFIDGKTKRGHWALMCKQCHALFGVGLGLGRGQVYDAVSGIMLDNPKKPSA